MSPPHAPDELSASTESQAAHATRTEEGAEGGKAPPGMLANATGQLGGGMIQRKLARRALQRKSASGGGTEQHTDGGGAAEHTGTPMAEPPEGGEAKADAKAGEAKAGEAKAPAVPPKSELSNAAAQDILTKAFGSVKAIVQGKIEVLEQAGFQAAYDKIYGAGPYAWDKYVKPNFGNLNGFAYDGTNYINKATAGLHTVVHEMLHNNTASDWTGVVGSEFNEGTTEYLTQKACAAVGEPAPVCYPGQTPCVQEALNQGLSESDLTSAYLKSGAQARIADWADKNCSENWAAIKGYMQAKSFAAARAGLQKKAAAKPAAAKEAAGGAGGG